MNTFILGVDFGTLSMRAILFDAKNGDMVVQHVEPYVHGVMDQDLHGIKLPYDYALQDPNDYLDALIKGINRLMQSSHVKKEDVIAMGIDFTSCTILPVDHAFNPLCSQDKFKNHPHAYVKLWKHHSAQKHADRATSIALERDEAFIHRYGNQISSEWMLPKVMEILHEDATIYQHTHRFMEAGDWIITKLTGKASMSSCQAGYKALWHHAQGFPSADYLAALDQRLVDFYRVKVASEVQEVHSEAGKLSAVFANQLGLSSGLPVAVAMIDAHSAVIGSGIVVPGKMLMIMGTSTCHMVLDQHEVHLKGISGVVKNGIVPGLYGYEAGQASVGDTIDWWVQHFVPQSYYDVAKNKNQSIFQVLNTLIKDKQEDASGLLSLDWLNGNRSILGNSHLSGLIMGLTLSTRCEDIYRSLIEATAFGSKKIIDQFEKNGVQIHEIYASGGIANKNALCMEIYANIIGKPIHIVQSEQSSALGAAISASVAAGTKHGGYANIEEAIHHMVKKSVEIYHPNESKHQKYKMLYKEYEKIHDFFGIEEKAMMENLKAQKGGVKHA
ncbi:MAG: ribulokinase [Acholeplasmataceae bacterium]|nr:ribulokinase [Acholeplasmataceae bacterium]